MCENERILRLSSTFLLLTLLALYPLSIASASSSPLDVIQSGSDRGLRIIKSSLFEEGPSLQQRRDEILRIVEEYFDFHEMARRSLGRPWRHTPPDKQKEFVLLFKQLLFNTYVSRIEATATPNTRTFYEGEQIDGRYALVKTRVENENQPFIRIDYRLLNTGTEWKVYDVVIEGVSLVDNYRQQFGSILNSESFDSLLRRLRERTETQQSFTR